MNPTKESLLLGSGMLYLNMVFGKYSRYLLDKESNNDPKNEKQRNYKQLHSNKENNIY